MQCKRLILFQTQICSVHKANYKALPKSTNMMFGIRLLLIEKPNYSIDIDIVML